MEQSSDVKNGLGIDLGPIPWFRVALTLVVLGGVAVVLTQGDYLSGEKILSSLRQFDRWTLFIVFACSFTQIGLMVVRLKALSPASFSLGGVLRATVFGHGVNMAVPAKMGEAVKVLLLSRMAPQKSLGEGAGILLADRIADLLALVFLILTSGVLTLPLLSGGLRWTTAAAGLMALTLVVAAAVHFGSKRSARVRGLLASLWTGLRGLRNPAQAGVTLAVGYVGWLVEVWAILVLVRVLGFDVSFAQGVFVLFVLNLAILLPISMGNVGTFEAAIAFALGSFGVGTEAAVAVAATHHGMQFVAIGVWLVIAWVTMPRGFSKELGEQMRLAANQARHHSAKRDETERTPDFEVTVGALSLGQGLKFLDVACGHGTLSLRAKTLGAYVYSVDAISGNVLPLVGHVDETEVATPEHLMVDQKFDRVFLPLDRCEFPDKAFIEALSRLNPGGQLVVQAPRSWQAPATPLPQVTTIALTNGQSLQVWTA